MAATALSEKITNAPEPYRRAAAAEFVMNEYAGLDTHAWERDFALLQEVVELWAEER